MRRVLLVAASAIALAACPTYDRYDKLADQKGLLPADEFAKYGREAAQKVAIGRALAQAHKGTSEADYARQMGEAVTFAKTMSEVIDIKADTLGYFMTIQFKSGWRTAVLPIPDGKKPEETPGIKG